MKVLLVGNGAREHAIAEAVLRSKRSAELFVFGVAKNPEIIKMASAYEVASLTDREGLSAFIKRSRPAIAIIGPEAPIADGIADFLEEKGVKCVAPFRVLAQVESSKSFTRYLLQKYNIPGNPRFKIFYDDEGIEAFMQELNGDYVVKADGLKGGKGVKVSGDHLCSIAEGLSYAKECLLNDGRVLVEEKFIGQEFSLMSFVDGKNVVDMPAVQDHKRAFERDCGPNTGGMGSYSDYNHSLPFLSQLDLEQAHEITKRVCQAVYEETGQRFKGILYGGFIATRHGVRLIEYNVRFGDPEAVNVLPILKTDFLDVCEAILTGTLDKIEVKFASKATVCKYVVPNGYPDNPVKDKKIEVARLPEGAKAYYAAVDQREDGLYLSSSRAIALVGIADNLEEAEKTAESAVSCVKGPVFHRSDIGTAALINNRVVMMSELRKLSR